MQPVICPENTGDRRGQAACRPDSQVLALEGVYWSTSGSVHLARTGQGWTEDSCRTQVRVQNREGGSQGHN